MYEGEVTQQGLATQPGLVSPWTLCLLMVEAHFKAFVKSALHSPVAVSCYVLRRYVGLWQTNVLALNLAAPPRLRQEPVKPTINFLFGDDSSARTQVDVPYNQRSGNASGLVHAYMLRSRCCCWNAALLLQFFT